MGYNNSFLSFKPKKEGLFDSCCVNDTQMFTKFCKILHVLLNSCVFYYKTVNTTYTQSIQRCLQAKFFRIKNFSKAEKKTEG